MIWNKEVEGLSDIFIGSGEFHYPVPKRRIFLWVHVTSVCFPKTPYKPTHQTIFIQPEEFQNVEACHPTPTQKYNFNQPFSFQVPLNPHLRSRHSEPHFNRACLLILRVMLGRLN